MMHKTDVLENQVVACGDRWEDAPCGAACLSAGGSLPPADTRRGQAGSGQRCAFRVKSGRRPSRSYLAISGSHCQPGELRSPQFYSIQEIRAFADRKTYPSSFAPSGRRQEFLTRKKHFGLSR
jgi:hypothetical protein